MDHETTEPDARPQGGSDLRPKPAEAITNSPFNRVPIEVTVSVGKARPLIKDLIALQRDSVLPLDRRIDDEVELFVGDRLIARGTLTELEDGASGQLAVKLTEVTEISKTL